MGALARPGAKIGCIHFAQAPIELESEPVSSSFTNHFRTVLSGGLLDGSGHIGAATRLRIDLAARADFAHRHYRNCFSIRRQKAKALLLTQA